MNENQKEELVSLLYLLERADGFNLGLTKSSENWFWLKIPDEVKPELDKIKLTIKKIFCEGRISNTVQQAPSKHIEIQKVNPKKGKTK